MFLFQKTFDIIAILTIITISMIIPILFSRNKVKFIWWDYVFPYLGVPFWFLLRELGVGDVVSSSNFLVEMFCILMASAAAPWIRFGLTFINSKSIPKLSLALTFLPLVVALLVRMVIPELPS
ncbi:MAG: hypothetical protein ABFS19_04510 [Thermodesulfobacteriota bacterium]